ncbi:MAG: hypothetical protein M1819_002448 [Sarea resinae]|nr:MAG: hypothetical protein M1819_002448 [Sarea resinae]
MWGLLTGKSSSKADDRSSKPPRRKASSVSSTRRRSESIVSSNATRKPPRGDDRAGYVPSSTSFASSSRSAYPSTAAASVASSYATATSKRPDETISTPGLVRNASMAERIPQARDERDARYGDTRGTERRRDRSTSPEWRDDRTERPRSRDRSDSTKEKKEKRDKVEKASSKGPSLSRSNSYQLDHGTSRAVPYSADPEARFSTQVGSSGFTQFPGQSGAPAQSYQPPTPAAQFSSHVPDQFPGQDPGNYASPYRPPISVSEGGPGLAAEYYGDQGQSVASQPGYSPQASAGVGKPQYPFPNVSSASQQFPLPTGGIQAVPGNLYGAVGSSYKPSSASDPVQPSKPSKPAKTSKPGKPSKTSKPGKASNANAVLGSAALASSAAAAFASSKPQATRPSNLSNNSSVYPVGPKPTNGNYGPPSQPIRPNGLSNGPSVYPNGPNPPTESYLPSSAIPSTSGGQYHSMSVPVVPTLGAAAAGAAAGYLVGNHASHESSQSYSEMASSQFLPTASARPPQSSGAAYISATSSNRPPIQGKQPSSHTNTPLYAAGVAGAAGAAGLAAAVHNQNHHPSHHYSASPYASGATMMQHRQRGPLDRFIDFWRDNEGVAQFEEYTQYIGVCKYCFPPGSTPREAPRKHHYRRRGSNERYGSSTRVDKESRYWSSDGENRRKKKKNKSWLASGATGYGLAKVGQSLFTTDHEINEAHSVLSGRVDERRHSYAGRPTSRSPARRSDTSRGVVRRTGLQERSNEISETQGMQPPRSTKLFRVPSQERVETRITDDGYVYQVAAASQRRSRSRSHDRDDGFIGAAIGTALTSSIAEQHPPKHLIPSPYPGDSVQRKRTTDQISRHGANDIKRQNPGSVPYSGGFPTAHARIPDEDLAPSAGIFGGLFTSSPERRKKARTRRKKGFFNFGNSSSSSSDLELAYGAGFEAGRGSKQRRTSERRAGDATAASLDLGAAALLAANASRKESKGRSELIAVKERRKRKGGTRYKDERVSVSESEEDAWESASEDDDASSVESGLAFGGFYDNGKGTAHASQDSLISQSSGTGKWGWRWGSKRRKSPSPRNSFSTTEQKASINLPGIEPAGPVIAADVLADGYRNGTRQSSSSSLPTLQHVYPVPTSDPSQFDVTRQSSVSSFQARPLMTSRPEPIPLQQPQPVAPVSSSVYTSQAQYLPTRAAPTGPPVFATQYTQAPRPMLEDGGEMQAHSTQASKPIDPFQFQVEDDAFQTSDVVLAPPAEAAHYPPPANVASNKESTTIQTRSRDPLTSIQKPRKEQAQTLPQLARSDARESAPDKKNRSETAPVYRDVAEQGIVQQRDRPIEANSVKAIRGSDRGNDPPNSDLQNRDAKKTRKDKKRTSDTQTFKGVAEVAGVAAATVVGMEGLSRAEERREKRREDRRNEAKRIIPPTNIQGSQDQHHLRDEINTEAESKDGVDDGSASDHDNDAFVRSILDKYNEEDKPLGAYFSIPDLVPTSKDNSQSGDRNQNSKIASYDTPQIVTVSPPDPSTSDRPDYGYYPNDEFVDQSHMTLPWSVPQLNLIKPTPPGSLAGSTQGDKSAPVSPVIAASNENVEDPTVEKATFGSRVTWGQPETREYTVVTPEGTRDDSITSASPSPPPEPRRREKEVPDYQPVAETEMPRRNDQSVATEEAATKEPQDLPSHMPGAFGDDLEFAATLAAGLQDSGFSPAIVVDDPTFRRRESPPGSEKPGFYHTPFAETVTDLGLDSPGTEGAPPIKGYVEGEIYEEPINMQDSKNPQAQEPEGREERVEKREKKAKRREEKAERRKDKAEKRDKQMEEPLRGVSTNSEVLEQSQTPNRDGDYDQDPERFHDVGHRDRFGDERPDQAVRRAGVEDYVYPATGQLDTSLDRFSRSIERGVQDTRGRSWSPGRRQVDDDSRAPMHEPSMEQEQPKWRTSRRSSSAGDFKDREIKSDVGTHGTIAKGSPDKGSSKSNVSKRHSADLTFSVHEPEPVVSIPSNAFDDLQLADVKKPKTKKSKRDSGRFDSSNPGSPLRSEITWSNPMQYEDNYSGRAGGWNDRSTTEDDIAVNVPLPEARTDELERYSRSESDDSKRAVADLESPLSSEDQPYRTPTKQGAEISELYDSPERDTRSVVSETTRDDYDRQKKSKGHKSKRHSDRYESPDRAGSVAASEPGGLDYDESRKSRRKSKRDSLDYEEPARGVSRSRSSKDDHEDSSRSRRKSKKDSSTLDDIVSGPKSDYEESRKKKHRSKREGLDYDDGASVASVTSAPVRGEYEESRKSRRKSKRDSGDFDDAASISSSPAKLIDKDEGKERKEKSRGFLGLFGSRKSQEDLPSSGKSKPEATEASFEDFEEPKKKHKKHKEKSRDRNSGGEIYDIYSSAAHSVSNLSEPAYFPSKEDDERRSHRSKDKEGKRRSREARSVDTGTITQDQISKDLNLTFSKQQVAETTEEAQDSEHFTSTSDSQATTEKAIDSLPPQPARSTSPHFPVLSGSVSPSASTSMPFSAPNIPDNEFPSLSQSDPEPVLVAEKAPQTPDNKDSLQARAPRPGSQDLTPAPITARRSSSTTIPIHFNFGRVPPSPGSSRTQPLYSSPVGSPQSPLPRPKSRHSRPNSTEFKASTEFRPLYLVERNNYRSEPDLEEPYPSLPSSRTSSQSGSLYDAEEGHARPDLQINTAQESDDPDYLDSQHPTPRAVSFPDSVKDVFEPSSLDTLIAEKQNESVRSISPIDDATYSPPHSPGRIVHSLHDLFPKHRPAEENDREESPPRVLSPPANQTKSLNPEPELLSSYAVHGAAVVGLAGTAGPAALNVLSKGESQTVEKWAPIVDLPEEGLAEDVGQDSESQSGFQTADEYDPVVLPLNTKKKKAKTKAKNQDKNFSSGQSSIQQNTGPSLKLADKPALSNDEKRQLAEQDAQDAVDSWFADPVPKNWKKDKGKKNGSKFQQSSGSSNAAQPVRIGQSKLQAEFDERSPERAPTVVAEQSPIAREEGNLVSPFDGLAEPLKELSQSGYIPADEGPVLHVPIRDGSSEDHLPAARDDEAPSTAAVLEEEVSTSNPDDKDSPSLPTTQPGTEDESQGHPVKSKKAKGKKKQKQVTFSEPLAQSSAESRKQNTQKGSPADVESVSPDLDLDQMYGATGNEAEISSHGIENTSGNRKDKKKKKKKARASSSEPFPEDSGEPQAIVFPEARDWVEGSSDQPTYSEPFEDRLRDLHPLKDETDVVLSQGNDAGAHLSESLAESTSNSEEITPRKGSPSRQSPADVHDSLYESIEAGSVEKQLEDPGIATSSPEQKIPTEAEEEMFQPAGKKSKAKKKKQKKAAKLSSAESNSEPYLDFQPKGLIATPARENAASIPKAEDTGLSQETVIEPTVQTSADQATSAEAPNELPVQIQPQPAVNAADTEQLYQNDDVETVEGSSSTSREQMPEAERSGDINAKSFGVDDHSLEPPAVPIPSDEKFTRSGADETRHEVNDVQDVHIPLSYDHSASTAQATNEIEGEVPAAEADPEAIPLPQDIDEDLLDESDRAIPEDASSEDAHSVPTPNVAPKVIPEVTSAGEQREQEATSVSLLDEACPSSPASSHTVLAPANEEIDKIRPDIENPLPAQTSPGNIQPASDVDLVTAPSSDAVRAISSQDQLQNEEEDLWALPAKKKGKKAKKQKSKALSPQSEVSGSLEAEQVASTSQATGPIASELTEPEAMTDRSPTIEIGENEGISWSVPSKKSKKSRKQKKEITGPDVGGSEPISTETMPKDIEATSSTPKQPEPDVVPISVDAPSQSAEIGDLPVQASPQAICADPPEEIHGASLIPSSALGNGQEPDPPSESLPLVEPEIAGAVSSLRIPEMAQDSISREENADGLQGIIPLESPQAVQEAPLELASDTAQPCTTSEDSPREATEEFWPSSPSSKKKNKKAKKQTLKQPLPATELEIPEERPTITDDIEADGGSAERMEVEKNSSLDQPRNIFQDDSLRTSTNLPTATNIIESQDEEPLEELWATPSKKKGKKSRKQAQASPKPEPGPFEEPQQSPGDIGVEGGAAENINPDSNAPSDADLATNSPLAQAEGGVREETFAPALDQQPEEQPEEAPEAMWAPSSKKKGKKSKKQKQASPAPEPEVSDAPRHVSEDDQILDPATERSDANIPLPLKQDNDILPEGSAIPTLEMPTEELPPKSPEEIPQGTFQEDSTTHAPENQPEEVAEKENEALIEDLPEEAEEGALDWTTSSKKKGKKAQKQKQASPAPESEIFSEPTPIAEQPTSSEAPDALSNKALAPALEKQPQEDPEDVWAVRSKKKGKKTKKLKQSLTSGPDLSTEPSPVSMADEASRNSTSLEDVPLTSALELQPQEESEEPWATSKKKEKKAKKQKQDSSGADTEKVSEEPETVGGTTERSGSRILVPSEQAIEDTPSGSFAPTVESQDVEVPEETWAISSKKQGRKARKQKQTSPNSGSENANRVPSQFELDTEARNIAEDTSDSRPILPASAQEDSLNKDLSGLASPMAESESQPREMSEEVWDPSLSEKKENQNKKSTTLEEASFPSSPTLATNTGDPISSASQPEMGFESVSTKSKKEKKKDKKKNKKMAKPEPSEEPEGLDNLDVNMAIDSWQPDSASPSSFPETRLSHAHQNFEPQEMKSSNTQVQGAELVLPEQSSLDNEKPEKDYGSQPPINDGSLPEPYSIDEEPLPVIATAFPVDPAVSSETAEAANAHREIALSPEETAGKTSANFEDSSELPSSDRAANQVENATLESSGDLPVSDKGIHERLPATEVASSRPDSEYVVDQQSTLPGPVESQDLDEAAKAPASESEPVFSIKKSKKDKKKAKKAKKAQDENEVENSDQQPISTLVEDVSTESIVPIQEVSMTPTAISTPAVQDSIHGRSDLAPSSLPSPSAIDRAFYDRTAETQPVSPSEQNSKEESLSADNTHLPVDKGISPEQGQTVPLESTAIEQAGLDNLEGLDQFEQKPISENVKLDKTVAEPAVLPTNIGEEETTRVEPITTSGGHLLKDANEHESSLELTEFSAPEISHNGHEEKEIIARSPSDQVSRETPLETAKAEPAESETQISPIQGASQLPTEEAEADTEAFFKPAKKSKKNKKQKKKQASASGYEDIILSDAPTREDPPKAVAEDRDGNVLKAVDPARPDFTEPDTLQEPRAQKEPEAQKELGAQHVPEAHQGSDEGQKTQQEADNHEETDIEPKPENVREPEIQSPEAQRIQQGPGFGEPDAWPEESHTYQPTQTIRPSPADSLIMSIREPPVVDPLPEQSPFGSSTAENASDEARQTSKEPAQAIVGLEQQNNPNDDVMSPEGENYETQQKLDESRPDERQNPEPVSLPLDNPPEHVLQPAVPFVADNPMAANISVSMLDPTTSLLFEGRSAVDDDLWPSTSKKKGKKGKKQKKGASSTPDPSRESQSFEDDSLMQDASQELAPASLEQTSKQITTDVEPSSTRIPSQPASADGSTPAEDDDVWALSSKKKGKKGKKQRNFSLAVTESDKDQKATSSSTPSEQEPASEPIIPIKPAPLAPSPDRETEDLPEPQSLEDPQSLEEPSSFGEPRSPDVAQSLDDQRALGEDTGTRTIEDNELHWALPGKKKGKKAKRQEKVAALAATFEPEGKEEASNAAEMVPEPEIMPGIFEESRTVPEQVVPPLEDQPEDFWSSGLKKKGKKNKRQQKSLSRSESVGESATPDEAIPASASADQGKGPEGLRNDETITETLPLEARADDSPPPDYPNEKVGRVGEDILSNPQSTEPEAFEDISKLEGPLEESAQPEQNSERDLGVAAASAAAIAGISAIASSSKSKKSKKKSKQKRSFDNADTQPFQEAAKSPPEVTEPRSLEEESTPKHSTEVVGEEAPPSRENSFGTSPNPEPLVERTPLTRDLYAEERKVIHEDASNRDSAVHVSDSPMLTGVPTQGFARDSGYHDNTASPMIENQQSSLGGSRVPTPQLRTSTRPSSPNLERDDPLFGQEPKGPADSTTSLVSRKGTNTSSSDPLNISVEIDPSYELSVRRDHSTLGNSHDDSGGSVEVLWRPEDSGSDVRAQGSTATRTDHLPNRARSMEELGPPSPVESTTKDRDSILFKASPATKDELAYLASLSSGNAEAQRADPEVFDRPRDVSDQEPKPMVENDDPNDPFGPSIPADSLRSQAQSPASKRSPEARESDNNLRTSLFGGPMGINSDSKPTSTPPTSPLGHASSERKRLHPTTEQLPDDSPLSKKSRAGSDMGLRNVDSRGTLRSTGSHHRLRESLRSPAGVAEHQPAPNQLISTDDLIARLSWPPVDDNDQTVDIERVKSRATDTRPASRRSNASGASGDALHVRGKENDHRTPSAQSLRSMRSGGSINRFQTPERDHLRAASIGSRLSNRSSGTPPLRHVDRSVSSDLRAASRRDEAKVAKEEQFGAFDQLDPLESSSTYDPTKDKGKGRAVNMAAEVYEGWGDVHGSPLSPTRPPSMRKRQSMQIMDLETRLDQLVSDNRLLQDAKAKAQQNLDDVQHQREQQSSALSEAIETRDLQLRDKDSELEQLKAYLASVQQEVTRLSQINEGLTATNASLSANHDERFHSLQAEHAHAIQQWQQQTRELDELRQQHEQLSSGMEEIVRHEISVALDEKNAEIDRLRDEVEAAKEQVRALQQQILDNKPSDNFLVVRDEDYFDNACQQLCQHVQQWVLRFSKFSDMRPCRLADEVTDEKIAERLDNAILDDSDVNDYLADRVRRRDVFMSLVMTMVWEYVFTRYLFGMDREQRQKLKSLEKMLSEVGPQKAVHQWRATTLTLLSQRQTFLGQRAQDTEAVVLEIFHTLSVLLPPPQNLEQQVLDSLRNVMRSAVELSIEMRTQRAEYIMLPPLQPEYDTNGDLVRKVTFNASLMNERSGETTSNEELEAQQAIVRMVLFPLVVKKGDDEGEGDEEIVVCPAQVLVAKPPEKKDKGKKVVRVVSGDRMDVDAVPPPPMMNRTTPQYGFVPSGLDPADMV